MGGLFAAVASGLVTTRANARAGSPALGDPVRWPTVRLLDGRLWGGEALAGQVVVVVFFSTTCPYCLRHNQRIARLADQAGPQGLRVLGVAHDTDAARVRHHLQTHGHRFDVTLDERPMHDALSQRRSVPLTCVVDRQGRLREVIPGEMTEDDALGLARWLAR